MKSYVVYDDCEYNDECEARVVWAYSKEEARNIYAKAYGDPSAIYDGSVKVIIREHDLGEIKPAQNVPHLERRLMVERAAGFRYEGDRCCESCGQYECDDTVPVCGECDCCKECGCLADCPNAGRLREREGTSL